MSKNVSAISTAPGVGGVAIIRISGDKSFEIINKIFDKDLTNANSHTIHYGHIIDNNEIIDEVLVSIMLAPKTFTKEDIVEINCHGGINTTNKVLELLLVNGCRLAEPGEFTKRAFLNGRIDLSQAEAVMDLINSKTELEAKESASQLSGKLSENISKIMSALKSSLLSTRLLFKLTMT